MLETKLIEKIPDPRDAEEQYQSFVRKKNTKSAKQSEVITYQPKSFENPSIVDVKSVIIEHPKTSHKFSRTEKVSQVRSNSSLYSDTKKNENFLNEKNIEITKRAHALKGFACSYNVEFQILLTLNYNLKILNRQLKTN